MWSFSQECENEEGTKQHMLAREKNNYISESLREFLAEEAGSDNSNQKSFLKEVMEDVEEIGKEDLSQYEPEGSEMEINAEDTVQATTIGTQQVAQDVINSSDSKADGGQGHVGESTELARPA